eukprot:TRINITY_DN3713_c0_g1_i8.p3 TRINITY_DN3713_c0_g1~~TRINITY_DN3713_c0_g1_i8.p3  ORF type:complete len:193 (-),score=11.30 TRINITY_DN3713_c0_g1_i8:107-685(-)
MSGTAFTQALNANLQYKQKGVVVQRRQVSIQAAVTTPSSNMQVGMDQAKILQQFQITAYSCTRYVYDFLQAPLIADFPKSKFIEHRLDVNSAQLAQGSDAVVIFVNDDVSEETLQVLKECGVKLIAFRCAGFDRLDMKAASKLGIKVVRVPSYSPTSCRACSRTFIGCQQKYSVSLQQSFGRKLYAKWIDRI